MSHKKVVQYLGSVYSCIRLQNSMHENCALYTRLPSCLNICKSNSPISVRSTTNKLRSESMQGNEIKTRYLPPPLDLIVSLLHGRLTLQQPRQVQPSAVQHVLGGSDLLELIVPSFVIDV